MKAVPGFPTHAPSHRHNGACTISVRYGAYLRTIPPANRFGDYVHCTARVVNIFFKRLLSMPLFTCRVALDKGEMGNGMSLGDFPEAKGPISQLIEALSQQAQGIPVVQHLAPRRTKAGTLDLTASTLFVRDVEKHARICEYARNLNKLIPFRHGQINLGVALQMLLKALHGLHALWRQKTNLTSDDLKRPGLDERIARGINITLLRVPRNHQLSIQ